MLNRSGLSSSTKEVCVGDASNVTASLNHGAQTRSINLVSPSKLFLTTPQFMLNSMDTNMAFSALFSSPEEEEEGEENDAPFDIASNSATRITATTTVTTNICSEAPSSSMATISLSQDKEMLPTTPTHVAGPQHKQVQQQQHKRRSTHESADIVFPHLAETNQKIRNLLGNCDCRNLQPQLMKIVNLYISYCRNDLEEVMASGQKCYKLARSISRTMDLLHYFTTFFEDTLEYIHRLIELVAIYVSCELRCAKDFKEYQLLVANRILQNILKYLSVSKDHTLSYILRMFSHISNMYGEREIMRNIFQHIIPKEQIVLQREFPDKIYIQYLIVFYHWQQLEVVQEDKLRVIEFANKFMRPSATLCTNATYAYHLPKYTSLTTATGYILQNLEFFHDLRNASIYDNRLNTGSIAIDICDDVEISTAQTNQNSNFAQIVESIETQAATSKSMIKLENPTVIATIDLTYDSNTRDNNLEWLQDLKRKALILKPANNVLAMLAAGNSSVLTEDTVIEIDSDDDDEVQQPNIQQLSHEQPTEQLDIQVPEYIDVSDTEEDEGLMSDSLNNNNNNNNNNYNNTNIETMTATAVTSSLSLVSSGDKNHNNSSNIPTLTTNLMPSKFNITSVCSIPTTNIINNNNSINKKNSKCERSTLTDLTSPRSAQHSSLKEHLSNSNNARNCMSSATQTDIIISDFRPTAASPTPDIPNIDDESTMQHTIQYYKNHSGAGSSASLRSVATTQTDCNSIRKSFNSETTATRLLSDQTKIIEGRCRPSFERLQPSLHYNGVTTNVGIIVKDTGGDNELTQVNPQIKAKPISVNASTLCNDDDYFYRRNSVHINSPQSVNETPIFSSKLPNIAAASAPCMENSTQDYENEVYSTGRNRTNLGTKNNETAFNQQNKVIYSVNKINCQRQENSEDEMVNENKRTPQSNKKKLVQFTDEPAKRKQNTQSKYPIKPAIKTTAHSAFNRQHTINNRVSSVSPASIASSQSQNRKEFHKSIPDEFTRYYSTQAADELCRPMKIPQQSLPDYLKRFMQTPIRRNTVQSSSRQEYYDSSSSFNNVVPTHNSPHHHNDAKLRKNCCVDVERHKELEHRCVQFMNELLEKQRAMRREALERKQKEERQRLLKEKILEEQKLKLEIEELKRQQEEKKKLRALKQQQLKKSLPKQRKNGKKFKETKLVGQNLELSKQQLQLSDDSITENTSLPKETVKIINNSSNIDELSRLPKDNNNTADNHCHSANNKTTENDKQQAITTPPLDVQQNDEGRRLQQLMNANDMEISEDEENRLLRTPTPEKNLLINPPSTIKSVKVRLKRTWNKETIKRRLRLDLAELEDEDPTSSLKMLANMAATAAQAEMQASSCTKQLKELLNDDVKTKSSNIKDAIGLAVPNIYEEEEKLCDYYDNTNNNNNEKTSDDDDHLQLPPLSSVLYNSCEFPPLIASSATSGVATATNLTTKKPNLGLVNIEPSPTVPVYLLNGESRHTSTPPVTPIPSTFEHTQIATAPAAITAAVVTADPIVNTDADGALSTSDNEVSSTQETLCCGNQKSRPHNNIVMPSVVGGCVLSALTTSAMSATLTTHSPESTTVPAAMTAVAQTPLTVAAVQNNQIDTTHHMPESTVHKSNKNSNNNNNNNRSNDISVNNLRTIRRHKRKYSAHDEIMLSSNTDPHRQQQQKQPPPFQPKRRKTICGVTSIAELSSTLLTEAEHKGTSPSTTTTTTATTTTIKKPAAAGRRRRHSPAVTKAITKAIDAVDKHNRSVITVTKPSLHEISSDSIVGATVAAAVAIKQERNCNSPDVQKLEGKKSKRIINNNSKKSRKNSSNNNNSRNKTVAKRTYSTKNIVKTVFVPPEIEKCLQQERSCPIVMDVDTVKSGATGNTKRNMEIGCSKVKTEIVTKAASKEYSEISVVPTITKDKKNAEKLRQNGKFVKIKNVNKKKDKKPINVVETQQPPQAATASSSNSKKTNVAKLPISEWRNNR